MASKIYSEKKTYLCHKCNHVFEAEDSLNLTCPTCGSDNIDEKSKKNGMLLPKILVFFAAAAIGYFVTESLSPIDNQEVKQPLPPSPVEPIASVSIDSDSVKVIEEVAPVVVVKPITIECSIPVNVDNRYVYSFKVSSNYDGNKKIEYHLLKSAEATEPSMISPDGQFNDVPPAENPEAFYWVYAIVKDENRTSDTIRIEGLKKRPIELQRISAAKLTNMLNERTTTRKSNEVYFHNPVKVDVVGIEVFSRLSDFESALVLNRKLRDKKVNVVGIEFDANNKVTLIKVEVVEN